MSGVIAILVLAVLVSIIIWAFISDYKFQPLALEVFNLLRKEPDNWEIVDKNTVIHKPTSIKVIIRSVCNEAYINDIKLKVGESARIIQEVEGLETVQTINALKRYNADTDERKINDILNDEIYN